MHLTSLDGSAIIAIIWKGAFAWVILHFALATLSPSTSAAWSGSRHGNVGQEEGFQDHLAEETNPDKLCGRNLQIATFCVSAFYTQYTQGGSRWSLTEIVMLENRTNKESCAQREEENDPGICKLP